MLRSSLLNGVALVSILTAGVAPTWGVPTLTFIEPQNGPPGTPIALSGSGFGTDTEGVTVTFIGAMDTAQAPVYAVSDDDIEALTAIIPPGAYDVFVTVAGESSNLLTFTVEAAPAIEDPVAAIQAFLADAGTAGNATDAPPRGTSLCTFPPENTATENLQQCFDTLADLDGSTVGLNDFATTIAELRNELELAVLELTPGEQLAIAQLLQATGVADVMQQAVDSIPDDPSFQGGLSYSTRCELGQLSALISAADTLYTAIASFPTEPNKEVIQSVISMAITAVNCILTYAATDLLEIRLLPPSATVGPDACDTGFTAEADFINNCPCPCTFRFGPLNIFSLTITIPPNSVTTSVRSGSLSWVGDGPIKPDGAYPNVLGNGHGAASLSGIEDNCGGIDFTAVALIDVVCCLSCNDNNLCTVDSCDVNTGACVHSPVSCDQQGVPVCNHNVCNPASGECEQQVCCENLSCNDGQGCTVNDRCQQGACQGDPKDCSKADALPCIVGTCVGDGVCIGAPLDCPDDGDPCTNDFCTNPDPCHTPITTCGPEEGCCPSGCDPDNDADCRERSCPADIDGNGAVDAADLAMLLGAWGVNPEHPSDFDGNGVINAADLALLLGAWGRCR